MKKIFWVQAAKRFALSGRVHVQAYHSENSFATGLSEGDIDPIQAWCEQHHCGRRTSFDTFQFKSKKEMTVFLLRWG